MIRNLIFDMGQVLMKWDPAYIAAQYTATPEDAAAFMAELIVQPDWYLVDAGQIAEADYYAGLEKRASDRFRDALLTCYKEFEKHMPPLADMHALANRAKAAGYGVYVLSNALPRFEQVLKTCPTLQCIDDMVISAKEGMAKPDPRIYQLALSRFGKPADECVFIDDLQENIDAAKAEGIHGIVFDGDVSKLLAALADLGVDLGTN